MANVEYNRINWKQSPSTKTPLSADNLNNMDKGIDDCATQVNQNTNDIGSLSEKVTKNTSDITKNTSDITSLNENLNEWKDLRFNDTGVADFVYGKMVQNNRVVSFVLKFTKKNYGYYIATGMPKPLQGIGIVPVSCLDNDNNTAASAFVSESGVLQCISDNTGTYTVAGTYLTQDND